MTSRTWNPSILAPARSRRRHVVCAAEHRPAYLPTSAAATPRADAPPTADDAEVGGLTTRLPVLAEVPELADALTDLAAADAAVRRAVLALGRLDEDLEVERATGVGIEHWLALACQQTRLDRRTLLRAARWTRRLPAFAAAIESGALSWAQAHTLTLVLRDLPAGHDRQADQLLGQLTAALPDDADPDAIVDQLRRACFRWRDELTPDHDPVPGNRLTIQPRLDGTGGTFHGEADATALAILDDATAPRRDQLDHPGGVAGIRGDNLLSRLLHTCPDQGEGASDGPLPPVELLARLDLDTALDTGRLPLELLTRLLGGRLQVTTAAARRLLDAHGSKLRTVLVDNGKVVGVGRATRVPPGWLTDGLLSIHDTCTGPVCDRPARGADSDHATPWSPIDGGAGGATDLDNLGPLCAVTNLAKEAAGWRAEQTPEGLRRWRHPRTGLTTTSVPATWRPPVTTSGPYPDGRPPSASPPAGGGGDPSRSQSPIRRRAGPG